MTAAPLDQSSPLQSHPRLGSWAGGISLLFRAVLAIMLGAIIDLFIFSRTPHSQEFVRAVVENWSSLYAGSLVLIWVIAANALIFAMVAPQVAPPRRARRLLLLLLILVAVDFQIILYSTAIAKTWDSLGQLLSNGPGLACGLLILHVLLGVFVPWKRWARDKHRTYIFGGLMGAVLVLDIVALSSISTLPVVFFGFGDPLFPGAGRNYLIFLGACLFIPVAVFLGLRRLQSGKALAGLYIAVLATGIYLAKDEPYHAETNLPTFWAGTPIPGDTSFTTLMRYGKNHPLGKNFHSPSRIFERGTMPDPSKGAAWAEWLISHRAAIESDWADLAPVREWFDELAKFDAIADLTPPKAQAEIVTFGPLRSYSQHAVAMAGLYTLDGDKDRAIGTLLPVIKVSRELEASSRTLVRTMIARVMQKISVAAVGFTLDQGPVSRPQRERLTAALNFGVSGVDGVAQLLVADGVLFRLSMRDLTLSQALSLWSYRAEANFGPLELLGRFVYNPNATMARAQARDIKLAGLASVPPGRDFNEAYRKIWTDSSRPTFKNFLGNYIVMAALPAYPVVIKSYWDTEARILELRTRLSQMAAND